MATQMDALSSFVFLTEQLPNWVTEVNNLVEYTSKKHAEFAAEYYRLIKHARPKKIKSPSLISHRSNESHPEVEQERSPKFEESFQLNPLEAGNRVLFANAMKSQRNTGVSVRSGASGPRRFRQKHAVVVYYDSHVQTSLEVMVKNISTARNNLRKGKKARSLARGPVFSSFGNFDSSIPDFKRSAIDFNPKSGSDASSHRKVTNIDSCFALADKELEQAQNLCETAAHQFLRDGDTTLELKNTQEKMERVLGFARETVELLREEKAQQEPEEAETPADEIGSPKFDFPPISSAKIYVPKSDPMAAIEVDSDDGTGDSFPEVFSKEFNVSRYRTFGRPNIIPT